jgi:hypothetical protein
MTTIEDGANQRIYWLDAAALVKLVSQPGEEPGVDRVQSLVERQGPFQTTWVGVAVAYGMLKRRFASGGTQRRNSADQDSYHRRIYLLRQKIADGTVAVRSDWLEREDLPPFNPLEVKDFAKHYEIDFLDALQIFEFRRGVAGAGDEHIVPLLVTSDLRLMKAAEALEIEVWNPDRGDLPE